MNGFGYPPSSLCDGSQCQYVVRQAFYKPGDIPFKIMLIGRDPRINKGAIERVTSVFMLNDPTSNLARWIRGKVIPTDIFDRVTIYATNVVKCTLNHKPDDPLLIKHFKNYQNSLREEFENYKPNLVLAFGKLAHRLVSETLFEEVPSLFVDAFTGDFHVIDNVLYSPCLHNTQWGPMDRGQPSKNVLVYQEPHLKLKVNLRAVWAKLKSANGD